jgi:hypothetical protein
MFIVNLCNAITDAVCVENGGSTLAGCQKWWDPTYLYAAGLGNVGTATWKKGSRFIFKITT